MVSISICRECMRQKYDCSIHLQSMEAMIARQDSGADRDIIILLIVLQADGTHPIGIQVGNGCLMCEFVQNEFCLLHRKILALCGVWRGDVATRGMILLVM